MTCGIPLETVAHKQDVVDRLVKQRLLRVNKGRVSCTNRGFLVLNQIINQLVI
jgi:hypothetical protein